MKKIIFTILISLFAFISKSQNRPDLPDFLIEGGDTIGIIISIEQAQALDNQGELLQLFKKLRINCDSLNDHYVSVINEFNQQVVLLKIKSSEKDKEIESLTNWKNTLNEKLRNCETSNKLSDEISKEKDGQIKTLKKEVKRQKLLKIGSGVLNVGLIIAILAIVL